MTEKVLACGQALWVLFFLPAPPLERKGELAYRLRRSYYGKRGLIEKAVREGFLRFVRGEENGTRCFKIKSLKAPTFWWGYSQVTV